jgi:hypothetical protein
LLNHFLRRGEGGKEGSERGRREGRERGTDLAEVGDGPQLFAKVELAEDVRNVLGAGLPAKCLFKSLQGQRVEQRFQKL